MGPHENFVSCVKFNHLAKFLNYKTVSKCNGFISLSSSTPIVVSYSTFYP